MIALRPGVLATLTAGASRAPAFAAAANAADAPLNPSNVPLDTANAPLNPSNVPLDAADVPLNPSNVPLDTANAPLNPSNVPLDTANFASGARDPPLHTAGLSRRPVSPPSITAGPSRRPVSPPSTTAGPSRTPALLAAAIASHMTDFVMIPRTVYESRAPLLHRLGIYEGMAAPPPRQGGYPPGIVQDFPDLTGTGLPDPLNQEYATNEHLAGRGINFVHNQKKGDTITTETDEGSVGAFKNTVAHVAAHMHAS
jgi:hypothetical protein